MILITGATGHTGRFLLEELFKRDPHPGIRCFVKRSSAHLDVLKNYDVEIAYGDIEDDISLAKALENIDTVIHIVNIRYSPRVMRLAMEAGVKRIIFIHTTGIFSKYRAYASEYERIEKEIIENCRISYVILRPTMIYGTVLDHNMHKLIAYIRTHRFFPVFGNGRGLMQPVYAGDLAKAIALVAERPGIGNRSYNISGGSVLRYRDILSIIAGMVNPGIKFIYIPYWMAFLLGALYEGFFNIIGKRSQISLEQIRRLNENKNFGFEDAKRDFGYMPISFREGIEKEIKSMGY